MARVFAQSEVGKLLVDEQERLAWADQVVAKTAKVLRENLRAMCPEEGEDLHVIERRVRTLLRAAGEVLMEACANRAADALPRPVCCGHPMHRAHRRARVVQGAMGGWALTRTEYVCDPCGRRCVPGDERLGFGSGQYSHLMAELTCRAGAEIPSFERAADLMGQALGLPVCADTLGRTCEAVGSVAEEEQQQATALARQLLTEPAAEVPPAEALPPHLALVRRALCRAETPALTADTTADGAATAATPSPDPTAVPVPAPFTLLLGVDATKAQADKVWRDVKVGVVAPLGPEQSPPKREGQHPRLVLGPRHYCAAIEDAQAFFYRLVVLLVWAGWRRSDPVRLVLTGDGGTWIWNYVERLRQLGVEVVEILDIYHAREHLWEVAHAVLGTGVRAHQWGQEMATVLKEKGPDPVLQALQALRPRGHNQKETVRKAIDYFTVNLARMDYPAYAACGLPLGSGIVESSCRLVSGLRVKQPGMRWSLSGVQAILSLRALHLSQTRAWDDFWRRKPLLRRHPIATLTRTDDRCA